MTPKMFQTLCSRCDRVIFLAFQAELPKVCDECADPKRFSTGGRNSNVRPAPSGSWDNALKELEERNTNES